MLPWQQPLRKPKISKRYNRIGYRVTFRETALTISHKRSFDSTVFTTDGSQHRNGSQIWPGDENVAKICCMQIIMRDLFNIPTYTYRCINSMVKQLINFQTGEDTYLLSLLVHKGQELVIRDTPSQRKTITHTKACFHTARSISCGLS